MKTLNDYIIYLQDVANEIGGEILVLKGYPSPETIDSFNASPVKAEFQNGYLYDFDFTDKDPNAILI